MKKTILATALTLVLVSQSALATEMNTEQTHHEPAIGFGVGAVVGVIVGGPLGGFIGGVLGGFIGETEAQKNQLELQQQQIVQAKEEQQHLQQVAQQNMKLEQQLVNVLQQHEQLLQQQGVTDMNVQFALGTSEIAPLFASQLQTLAQQLIEQPQAQIDLTGFADKAGTTDFNLALSKQRVASVKQFLIDHGVDGARLTEQAHGETQALATIDDIEGRRFDRRVSIAVLTAPQTMMAEIATDDSALLTTANN